MSKTIDSKRFKKGKTYTLALVKSVTVNGELEPHTFCLNMQYRDTVRVKVGNEVQRIAMFSNSESSLEWVKGTREVTITEHEYIADNPKNPKSMTVGLSNIVDGMMF